MITIRKKEQAIIVAVQMHPDDKQFDQSVAELTSLVENTGICAVAQLTQKRESPDPRHFIGKGKLQELKQAVEDYDADVIIFNHELSPSQVRNIQEEIDVKVLDRVQVILDIFAMRAHSKEGALQVHLAQLNYLLPRLVGHGINMSRLGGGIGTRGPGETKLETDRRHINRQISEIENELKKTAEHRERSREQRRSSGVVQIGLIGYTNAGKSSLLNALTGSDTFEKDILFATLDPVTRKLDLPSGLQTTLTDTVGFIQDLPTELIEAFQSTLEESRDVDLLLHVIDASSNDFMQHEETVDELLNQLEMSHIPTLTVYNKADLLEYEFVPLTYPNIVMSARSEEDIERLKSVLEDELMKIMIPYRVEVPVSRGDKLAEIKQETLVENEAYDEERNVYLIEGFVKKDAQWILQIDEE